MEVSGQFHTPAALNPKERAPGTHCIGGWVGPRAGLDAVVKRKIPSPRRESNPRTPIVQPEVQRYTDWTIKYFLRSPHTFCITNYVQCLRTTSVSAGCKLCDG
jgi:hypothetical protein